MYNYHTELVWIINKILLSIVLFLSLLIIAYSAIQELLTRKRTHNLAIIRNNLSRLAQSGGEAVKEVCPVIIGKASVEQFIEIARNGDSVLPKQFEQQLKECFIASGKTEQIEKIAKFSKNKWYRIQAIISLGYTNSPKALGILKDSIQDKNEDVSYFSMLALGQIRNNASAKILLDFLGKHVYSGYKIASLLEVFPPAISEEIIQSTYSEDSFVRFWAIKILSKLKPENHQKRIEDLTNDKSPDVRAAACECLGELSLKEAKDSLLHCLNDEVWFVRMHAVRSLTKILGAESIPVIINLITDKFWLVRDSIKRAMIINIDASMPYIEQILKGDSSAAKRDCIEAIEESGYLVTLLKNISSHDREIRYKAAGLLKGIVSSGGHFGLQSALVEFDVDSKKNILEKIAEIDKDLSGHISNKIKGETLQP